MEVYCVDGHESKLVATVLVVWLSPWLRRR
jgi:hypothetical protein